jgi:bifunctional ADP-heptose synthase (sugar kinase/adenylyltransferase)
LPTKWIRFCEWLNSESALTKADAVVVSREDLNGDEEQIEHIAHHTKLLAVTEGAAGCVLYWHGDRRRFRALEVQEVDPTGAGDIFAAAFFFRLLKTRDPWEAARFATILASYSVTRDGLDGISLVSVCPLAKTLKATGILRTDRKSDDSHLHSRQPKRWSGQNHHRHQHCRLPCPTGTARTRC